jgi:hypothetical protein
MALTELLAPTRQRGFRVIQALQAEISMLFFEIPGHEFLDGFGRDPAYLKVDILVRLDETGCIATFVPF